MQEDHQDKMLELAGRIANDIINGVPVPYGYHHYEVYAMGDVIEYINGDSDHAEELASINESMALSLNNEIALDKFKKEFEDFMFERIGEFAESVVSRVYNYIGECNAADLAESLK